MRGWRGGGRLPRDAPHAGRVARVGHREGCLPPVQEQVLGGQTVILGGAADELAQDGVGGRLLQPRLDPRQDLPIVVVACCGVVHGIGADGSRHEGGSVPTHRTVRPEGKGSLWCGIGCGREEGPGVARRQKGRHGRAGDAPPPDPHARDRPEFAPATIPGERPAPRHGEQLGAFGDPQQVLGRDLDHVSPQPADHLERGMVEDLPFGIGDDQFRHEISLVRGARVYPLRVEGATLPTAVFRREEQRSARIFHAKIAKGAKRGRGWSLP